jgi:hypothetical protein
MQCTTLRKGAKCSFMTKKGCNSSGGSCYPVVEACEGCARTTTTDEGTFCLVAPNPARKWANGPCNFATHRQVDVVEQVQKLNPLKASKRAASGKKK